MREVLSENLRPHLVNSSSRFEPNTWVTIVLNIKYCPLQWNFGTPTTFIQTYLHPTASKWLLLHKIFMGMVSLTTPDIIELTVFIARNSSLYISNTKNILPKVPLPIAFYILYHPLMSWSCEWAGLPSDEGRLSCYGLTFIFFGLVPNTALLLIPYVWKSIFKHKKNTERE